MVTDTILAGYIVRYADRQQNIPKTQTEFTATSLSPGSVTFFINPVAQSGQTADGVQITWAPAKRFLLTYTLTEYTPPEPARPAALFLGTETTPPHVAPLAVFGQRSPDLYLGGTAIPDSLFLKSPILFDPVWNATSFSVETDSAGSLDYYRSTFPSTTSFTRGQMVALDNRIYYVRTAADQAGTWLFARIHVHVLPGLSYPNRSVQITISLQRVPGLPFASADPFVDRPCVPSGVFRAVLADAS